MVMLTAALMVSEKAVLAVFCAESVTVMVKELGPDVVGLPVIMPAADKLSPAGSEEPAFSAQL